MLTKEDIGFFCSYGMIEQGVVNILRERHFEIVNGDAVVFAKLEPAVAERTAVDDERFPLGGNVILHDGTHGARAGTCINDGSSARAVNQVEKHSLRLLIDLRKRVGPHINERLGADGGDSGIDVAGENVGVHDSFQ